MERSVVQGSLGKGCIGSQRQSCDEYRLVKVLPHIKEEFYYRVENKLMVQKITNPRRDKSIVDSLANTTTYKRCSRRKKRPRKQTPLAHRRKLVLSGYIKRQLRPQTCQPQSRLPPHNHHEGQQSYGREEWDQKQCSSTLPERFQLANQTPKSRWMLTDPLCLREGSIGRIVKNTLKNRIRIGKLTTNYDNRCSKLENSVTLPCETIKEKNVLMQHYLCMQPSQMKKLERRPYPQHFHNKENLPLPQQA